jgi:hypothetical protein
MKILFNEQDMIDSVCVFAASRHQQQPEHFGAELFYEEHKGFSAETTVQHGYIKYNFTEQDIIDGIAMYLRDTHNFDPYRLSIELFFEEGKGFSAEITLR